MSAQGTFSHSLDPKQSLAMPQEIEHWSLITLRENVVEIGANILSRGREVTFQMAEVPLPRHRCSRKSSN